MPLNIGVGGWGETSAKNVKALFDDFLASLEEPPHLVFCLTTDEDGGMAPAVRALADLVMDDDTLTFTVIRGEDLPSGALAKDLVRYATKTEKVASPTSRTVRGADRVFIAYAEDDEDANNLLIAAEREAVPAFDLVEGLLPLSFDDEPAQAEAEPEPTPEPEPKPVVTEEERPRRRRRTKAEIEADKQAAAEAEAAEAAPEPQEAPQEPEDAPVQAETPASLAEAAAAGESTRAAVLEDAVEAVHEVEAEEIVKSALMHALHALSLEDERNAAVNLAEPFHRPLTLLVQDAVRAYPQVLAKIPVKRSPGRPRKDGSPAQPRERDEDGNPVRRRPGDSGDY